MKVYSTAKPIKISPELVQRVLAQQQQLVALKKDGAQTEAGVWHVTQPATVPAWAADKVAV